MVLNDGFVQDLRRDALPLRGRVAVVTGVGRRAGIGYATARRLAAYGADLMLHHYAPHDREQPWGADPGGPDAVVAGVAEALTDGARVEHVSLDLADPDAPRRLLDAAVQSFGHVDVLVCNHARSGGDGPLQAQSAETLDAHWAVNTRSVILLTKAFAAQHDGRPGGRVMFMTSGQELGPMRDEVAYAASKGALASISRTLADELADQRITLNTVNPGPVDTGYAPPEVVRRLAEEHFPQRRWGHADDPARLIAWLATDEAEWITGQVINTEGGFRRHGPH
ncbi:SDR family oxidoreductase [Actinomadura sp. HBU206391]|uniref:SDR family oxidoreductase n=1 Tax=Actinomadura sp. HBU206391 TaxID=2731692 RepID=UPI00165052C9|nr:SDR family oxidoreductase [Actinomadura sp. HBU206391]MBC6463012.1 SDR family oxidoreductase [Actinomadura sp. HBU206391]